MLIAPQNCRVAIAGASSLRGKELAAVLEESSFPASEVRLLDDEVVDGTLTEAGGEPAVIQGVDEESFDGARFAFFTGTPAFTRRHWPHAGRSGATVIDLSGILAREAKAVSWIPALRGKLPPPQPATGKLFHSPPAPAIIACTLAVALRKTRMRRLAIIFFQPVSERGQAGIEELEAQAVNLLSMKPIAQPVFDAQVAFNLLDRYGEESTERLADLNAEIAADVARYLNGRIPVPAIQLVHAPVFYGYAFAAFAEMESPCDPGVLERAIEAVGVRVASRAADSPSNVSVAGDSHVSLARIERDMNTPNSFWFWGAADNMRLSAANAVSIAETLLAS